MVSVSALFISIKVMAMECREQGQQEGAHQVQTSGQTCYRPLPGFQGLSQNVMPQAQG